MRLRINIEASSTRKMVFLYAAGASDKIYRNRAPLHKFYTVFKAFGQHRMIHDEKNKKNMIREYYT